MTCTGLVNSLYRISVPIAEVLRLLGETCSYILVIDRHVPGRWVLKVTVAAEGWYGISCHRFEMTLGKAFGTRHGSCSSVPDRLEQGCTNFGYQVTRAE